MGKIEHAKLVIPLFADADPVVAHTAVQALKQLKASDVCFGVVDTVGADLFERAGALRVLQSLHDVKIVDGLIARLAKDTDITRRKGLLTALCRLHSKEGVWKGDSWGTRPDTSGPYYQAEEWSESKKIVDVLKGALAKAKGEEAAHLVSEFNRHKIQSDDAINTVIELASKDATLIPAAIGQLSRAERIPSSAVPFLIKTASAESTADITRAGAVTALVKTDGADAIRTALNALPLLEPQNKNQSAGTERERRLARDAFFNSAKLDLHHGIFETDAKSLNGETSPWSDAALLKIADRKNGSPETREAAKHALDAGWSDTKRRAQILQAVRLVEHRPYKDKVLEALDDVSTDVAKAAKSAASALRLDPAKDKAAKGAKPVTIADMKVTDIISEVLKTHGDIKLGEQLFTQQACVNCHTVRTDEPQRGPFLGNIATTYKRPELTEAILNPSKSIAQGFLANFFELKDGTEHEGFVTLEAADKVVIRNVAAQEITIPVKDIKERRKLEKSLMPEGLAGNLNIKELASLVDYLEALAKK